MPEFRIFVSSVQKELEDERAIIRNLLNTDPFLNSHCLPVLYEFEPASPQPAVEGCLSTLDACQAYLLIVASEYGVRFGDFSITHLEYRRAKARGLPVLAFIKGDRSAWREEGTASLLAELDSDGFKYKRFGNVVELQKEVRSALVKLLGERFGIAPTGDENEIAEHTIEATSPFESRPWTRLRWKDLDHAVVRQLVATAEKREPKGLTESELVAGAIGRGLLWHDSANGEHYPTAAGIVLLAKDPSIVFPHCRILADAYKGSEPDSYPRDQEDIRAPAPLAVERALAFVDRNTRHPMRIVGIDRVRLDEYPVKALREALVNAAAHRQYEDGGRKIMLEVFSNRVVIASPGMPPAPVTLASLRRGKYRPCSRNPVLAHCLSYFHRVEERGSGFRRMQDHMLDHGLDPLQIGTNTGYFEIIFPGPADNIERLRVPDAKRVAPSVEKKLNERQRAIRVRALEEGSVTTKWCMETLGVVRDTAHRDLLGLVALGLLAQRGAGRAVSYVPPEDLLESSDNHPIKG